MFDYDDTKKFSSSEKKDDDQNKEQSLSEEVTKPLPKPKTIEFKIPSHYDQAECGEE